MPKPQSEEDKKHGDKLGSLVGRTGGASAPDKRDQSAAQDDATGADDDDPAQLQDDDDEDLQNDDDDSARDVGDTQ